MKKVLSIFMAILMVMSAFSVMAFAEDEVTEEVLPVCTYYVGGARGTQTALGGSKGKNEANALAFSCFDLEGRGGNKVIPAINKDVTSGKYSAIEIIVCGGSLTAVEFEGLVGTAATPIIFKAKTGDAVATPVFESENTSLVAPAINVVDCEYVTFEKLGAKSSLYHGVKVEDSSNITFKGMEFTNVGYTDYELPIFEDAEAGIVEYPAMDTTGILEKGAALLIGAGNTDITADGCKFTNCRVGVLVDSTKPVAEEPETVEEGEETEEPVVTSGVSILNGNFANINNAAVILNSADEVLVSGGKASNVGTLTAAPNYDGTPVAVVDVKDSKDVVVERMFSSYNESFVNFENSTGKVRYNVSDGDGEGSIGEGVLVYNNTFVNASALEIATAYNNIFAMVIGEKVSVGEGDANCYYWTSKGKGGFKKNPKFANAFDGMTEGQDPIDNYRLSTISPCLGAGVKCDDDMGTVDFYGNEIGDTINVGADMGTGVEATTEIVSDFVDFFNYIIAFIKNLLGIK